MITIVLITVGHFRPCKNYEKNHEIHVASTHRKLTTAFILTLDIIDCGFQFKLQHCLSNIDHTHYLQSRWVWCEVTSDNVIGNAIAAHKTFDCGSN